MLELRPAIKEVKDISIFNGMDLDKAEDFAYHIQEWAEEVENIGAEVEILPYSDKMEIIINRTNR